MLQLPPQKERKRIFQAEKGDKTVKKECLLDDKRCYIHHDNDGFEVRCRHGDWIEATVPPCQKQRDVIMRKVGR